MVGKNNKVKMLIDTERGKQWLAQFAPDDRPVAERIASSLTLVSLSAFERGILEVLKCVAAENGGPFAFFATREIAKNAILFDKETGKANLLTGPDYGSEARVSTLIRNLCKTKSEKFLNQPSIEEMRSVKCRSIVLVDDFVGSGCRSIKFMKSIYKHPTIASWHSYGLVKFIIVVYSATESGLRHIKNRKLSPTTYIARNCPTLKEMPWERSLKKPVLNVCKKYGKKTLKAKMWGGFDEQMAALVFEHGCPNNAPAILWAPNHPEKPWCALFPGRSVEVEEASIFSLDINTPDAIAALRDAGQKNLAASAQFSDWEDSGTNTDILKVLALIARGYRKQSGLSYVTGLRRDECLQITEKCIEWGFLTPARQITEKGLAELKAARHYRRPYAGRLEKGDDLYYPSQLRVTVGG